MEIKYVVCRQWDGQREDLFTFNDPVVALDVCKQLSSKTFGADFLVEVRFD